MKTKNWAGMSLLLLIFFAISFDTNVIGPLLPDLIKQFRLSLTTAAFLPFSFFAAYAVLSIPAGAAVERWGEKPVLLSAFTLAGLGAAAFALWPSYPTALLSLFAIGSGMAALQVAINPLLRVTGGEENFAFNSVLAQFVFGLASFASPLVYSHYAIVRMPQSPWIPMYAFIALSSVVLILTTAWVRWPRVDRTDDERPGTLATHLELLRLPVVWLYVLAIFSYVGLEQGLANFMSQFLESVHGLNPQTHGAEAVSRFWLFMTVGCGVGLVLLKFFDSKKVLLLFSSLGLAGLVCALFGTAPVSLTAFAFCGFAISVLWSIPFSLALNSLPRHHGTFSGLMCTGIVGGAVVPMVIGVFGDHFGLRAGLCFLFVPLAYLFSIGLWARPLILNKTIAFESREAHADVAR